MVSRPRMDAGIVPVKRLSRAKGRLEGHFSRGDCTRIAHAMFEDALALCRAVDFISWWVVSDDSDVIEAAAAQGVSIHQDRGAGLNPALVEAIALVTEAGARSVTIFPSDIPLARRADLVDVLDTGATSDLVVVPSRADGGTNALYISPADLIEPQFGSGSLAAHVRKAEERRLRCSILPLERMELDIDTIDDVDAFLELSAREGAGRTAEVLRELRSG
jgi:2-phospho-L-lactate/phosphoenolpyruvate guanylyltransferase